MNRIRNTTEATVLDVWGSIEPRFGGVGPAASSLATAVSRLSGMRSRQIAICARDEISRADGIDSQVTAITDDLPRPWADRRLRIELQEAVAQSDVCHVHGLWMPHCLATRSLARQAHKPLVSSVHGMLEKWELKSKGLGKNIKKGLYARLFERASLNHSTCLRALSEREAEDYANFGATPPIAVIPNGIGTLIRREPTELFNNFSQFRGKKIVLFLARIHQKKGILNLVRAWPEVVRNHPDAHLAIAGGEYEDTGDKMRQLVAGLGISRSVTAMGVINGETKIQALSAASFLCLPSFSEGLSVTVLESLSIGLPVIVTRACNIDIAAKRGAGFVSSNSPEKLSETLVDALALPADKHEAMSNAARELASSEFHWNKVAEKMALVYAWLLGAEKPSFVLN